MSLSYRCNILSGSAILAMLLLCHDTVTGSTKVIRASNGPMLVIAPFSARAKPLFVMSLINSSTFATGAR